MFTPKFIKDDWVKRKGSNQLMQIEEYQTEEVSSDPNKWGIKTAVRKYNGKVWCSWINKNKAFVTQPFLESELEPVKWLEESIKSK
jgi:hypothetical protein